MDYLFALIITATAYNLPADLTPRQKAWEQGWQAANFIDYGQTRQISVECQNGENRWELNPIMGKCPTLDQVNNYFAVYSATHYLVTKALPGEYRNYWLYGSTIAAVANVARNGAFGISLNYNF